MISGLSLSLVASAQFYFQDIVNAERTSLQFQILKSKKIQRVSVSSIEPSGNATPNFGITQTIDAASNKLLTITKSDYTGSSRLDVRFNQANMPISTVDSLGNTVNTISYVYDNNNRLVKLSSSSQEVGDSGKYIIGEDHLFSYNTAGILTQMLKIKGRNDTTFVKFIADTNGKPAKEIWYKAGKKLETWYYYYDENNRLTDVVRYNELNKKMIPDYTFEYNEDNQLSQQILVTAGSNFYRLWLYEYNDNGLRAAETIFNKGKEQIGRILYSYQ